MDEICDAAMSPALKRKYKHSPSREQHIQSTIKIDAASFKKSQRDKVAARIVGSNDISRTGNGGAKHSRRKSNAVDRKNDTGPKSPRNDSFKGGNPHNNSPGNNRKNQRNNIQDNKIRNGGNTKRGQNAVQKGGKANSRVTGANRISTTASRIKGGGRKGVKERPRTSGGRKQGGRFYSIVYTCTNAGGALSRRLLVLFLPVCLFDLKRYLIS